MRRQHNIPTFTAIIANRHSAAVWEFIPGVGCHLDFTVMAGGAGRTPKTPAAVASVTTPSKVFTAVATTTTRVSNRPKPGPAACHGSTMPLQHSIPSVISSIVNRHSAAVWTRIPGTTPATVTRATLSTTEVAGDVIRRAGVKDIMSIMGRPVIPRSPAASITRATVATT